MDLDRYNNLSDALSGTMKESNPQLYDQVNDKKVYAKSILEASGNILGMNAITTGISKLKKSKNILDRLGLKEEDLDGLQEDLSNGDMQSVLAKVSKSLLNKKSAQLQKAISKAKGQNTDDVPDTDEVPDSGTGPTVTGTEDPPPPPAGAGGEGAGAGGAGSSAEAAASVVPKPVASITQEAEDAAQNMSSQVENIGIKAGKDAITAAQKAVQAGGKVEDVLKTLTVDSLSEDEANPFGFIVTAALGIATLVGGLFERTHHNAYETPPLQSAKTYSVTQGVDF